MGTHDYPRKRPRIEANTKAKLYTNASDIRSALHTDNVEALTEALTVLRNQLTVKTFESAIAPADARLNIVKQWMQLSHGANDLFLIWDTANSRQSSLIALLLSILSSILTLLSTHYTDHALGQPIIKTLTGPSRFRQLNSYLGGSHNELIIVTLKLYNVMSTFASGKDKKAVLEGFGWEIKSLPKLLNMRRKSHGEKDTSDPLLRPDIRTLYILLLLSFVEPDSLAQTKTTFLEQHREAFLAVFKGILHDHYTLARKILEVCWAGIWLDSKIKRTLKVGLFNETTLGHLLKLYDRIQSDDGDDDHVPANLVHHFLLAICTRSGTGICFKDRGWYPRETDVDDLIPKEDIDQRKKAKIYNIILANMLKTLKVNEDSRQQELAIKILAACPELVAGYWSAAALTLEPRLSSKWITNIAVFGNIISLPVPTSSFYMSNTQLYQPTPPPLFALIENILPSVGTKNNFSKGLQSPSGLVQHCTALALSRCLVKYEIVDEQFRKISEALEENESEGQWFKRRRELEREVRRRVPEFQVVVGFSQQRHIGPQGQVNHAKVALLAESAQRLLWLYHRCLPAVVAEARFDVGKLLQTFSQDTASSSTGDDDNDSVDVPGRLYRVQQLHVLSLLKDSNQFIWTGKIASLPHTPFRVLLTALAFTSVSAIVKAVATLLQHILSQSIMFQEDRQEPDLWLKALPTRPAIMVRSESGTLQGEAEGVIFFIDDCVQRCLKTPYRYIEALHAFSQHSHPNSDITERLAMLPSPLLMTVIEQLDAKIKNNSLSPAHFLGIVSFIRKLLVKLASKTSDLCFIRAYAHKIDEILLDQRLSSDSPTTFTAIRREVDILYASLSFSSFDKPMASGNIPELETYLSIAEQLPIADSKTLRDTAAVRLVDWMRTLTLPVGPNELKRLITLVTTLDASMLPAILENLIPGQIDLWGTLDLVSSFSEYRRFFEFEWLYVHTGAQQIIDERCQTVLCESIFAHGHTFANATRAVYLVMHGVSAARQQDNILKGHFSLLAKILESSAGRLSSADFSVIKDVIFVQSGVLKDIMMSPMSDEIIEGVELVLRSAIRASSANDLKIVSTISNHWFNVLRTGLENQISASITTGCVWIKYLDYEYLFDLLDFLEHEAQNKNPGLLLLPLNVVLETLCATSAFDWQAERTLALRLPRLLSLKSILSDSPLLEQVIAIIINASLPIGLDGCSIPSITTDLVTVIRRTEYRWSQRHHLAEVNMDIRPFLVQQTFSDSTVKIISGLLYRQPSSRQIFAEWLTSKHCLERGSEHLVPIVHAFLDSSSTATVPSIAFAIDNAIWISFLRNIVKAITDAESSPTLRTQARGCLLEIISSSALNAPKVLNEFVKVLKTLPPTVLKEFIPTAVSLANKFGSKAGSVLEIVVDGGTRWCIDQFAQKSETPELNLTTEALTLLVEKASVTQSHLMETLLTVIMQTRYNNVSALRLAAACLSTCQLKPLIVNRHLQSIIQHPYFFKICASSSLESSDIRDAMVELLYCLFMLHPHNTCQITHIEPLISIYRGTLSITDLRILSIFRLFEGQRKLSTMAIVSKWSSTPNVSSNTALEGFQSLDPIVVLRTCLHFPRWRRAEVQLTMKVAAQEATLYDPVFLMLLFSHMLAEQPPTSAFGWIELFRTNIISLFIRALSSKDGRIRDLALCQIVGLWKFTETADLQEKPHVMYILNLLKDLMPLPSSSRDVDEYPRRLPTYTTLLLMHALRAIFNPSNFIYPITARFLLQRPSLDTTDVPMLFGLLYSSSDENWKKERGWMVRFLADGMMGSEDWRILKRRHTWDLLASLFQSSDELQDSAIRMGILEILANITCNAQAVSSLILKSALLPWIETQLLQSNSKAEGVEWIKIIENILIIADCRKVETATNGEWRAIICRCLCSLLDEKTSTTAAQNFAHAVPVILRLTTLSSPKSKCLADLLDLSVRCLESLEKDLQLDLFAPLSGCGNETNPIPSAPHYSFTLHQRISVSQPSQQLLVTILEMLWRASMALDYKCPAWEKLTPRMLLWRSVTDEENFAASGVFDSADWVRKEVVKNLGESASL